MFVEPFRFRTQEGSPDDGTITLTNAAGAVWRDASYMATTPEELFEKDADLMESFMQWEKGELPEGHPTF